MPGISFADAQKIKIGNVPTIKMMDVPFNSNLMFNRIIHTGTGRAKEPIRSVNSASILRNLENDKISTLLKISLACSMHKEGLTMWDVLFNLTDRCGFNSCVFVADKEFNPLPRNRVLSSSHFMNYAYPNVRLHLNKIEVGDKIGIGIFNATKRTTYVLIYDTVGTCLARDPDVAKNKDYKVIHAMNCQLEKIYRFDKNGNGDLITLIENDDGDPKHFVERIFNAAMDIENAYSWKPHFLPESVLGWDREGLESNLTTLMESTLPSSYEDFEDACRDAYNNGRALRHAALDESKDSADRKSTKKVLTPLVQVATLGNGTVIASLLDRNTNEMQSFRFPLETVGKSSATEKFLLNQDIESWMLGESTDILVLSENLFGKDSIVRFLNVNF